MSIENYIKIVILAESERETLVQEKLPIDRKDLEPVMSEMTVKYHYDKLAAGYVKRYNDKEGDDNFNYGGAALHNIFFVQLKKPSSGNRPLGISKEIIDKKYKSFDNFKEAFTVEFMKAQGSNWIYMDVNGNIATIHNHEFRKGMKIALLIDAWEHAWFADYGPDKTKYLNNIWRIINWNVVDIRIQGA